MSTAWPVIREKILKGGLELTVAVRALDKFFGHRPQSITPEEHFHRKLDDIAIRRNTTAQAILGSSAERNLTAARQELLLWMREEYGWSTPRIARLAGFKPDMVRHAIERAKRNRKNPPAQLSLDI